MFVKLPLLKVAKVIALRRIEKGEELFANYGKMYWAGGQYSAKLSSFTLYKLIKIHVHDESNNSV
jgi:hypothetical protein